MFIRRQLRKQKGKPQAEKNICQMYTWQRAFARIHKETYKSILRRQPKFLKRQKIWKDASPKKAYECQKVHKKMLKSTDLREIQTTTMRSQYVFISRTNLATDNTACWPECRETRILVYCWWKCKMIHPLPITFWWYLRKWNVHSLYNPARLLLQICLINENTSIHRLVCGSSWSYP